MSELQTRGRRAASIWQENPVLVHLFGLSPILAVSTSLGKGLALGILTFVALQLATLIISLIKGPDSESWRFAWGLLILAACTTVLELLLQTFFYPLYRELGIYVALICCNFAILLRLEDYATASDWKDSLSDSVKLGAGFLLAISLISGIRESLLYGSLLHDWRLLLPNADATEIENPERFVEVMNLAPAALIFLGLLIAALKAIEALTPRQPAKDNSTIIRAERARVTAKL